eukprot:1639317-Rhodomonas_salina.1
MQYRAVHTPGTCGGVALGSRESCSGAKEEERALQKQKSALAYKYSNRENAGYRGFRGRNSSIGDRAQG